MLKLQHSIKNGTTNQCPFWHYDDVTECGRVKYNNFLFPLTITGIGVIFVSYNTLKHYYRYNILKKRKFIGIDEILYSNNEEETAPLISDESRSESYSGINESAAVNGERLKESHFSIEKIKLVKLNGEPHGKPTLINRGFIEKSRIILELFLVIIQVFCHIFIYLNYSNRDIREFSTRNCIVSITQWLFLLAVVTLRLLNVNQSVDWIVKYPGNLWSVSFLSYLFIFVSNILPFRSIYIGHITDSLTKHYYVSEFWLSLVLFCLLFFSPVGNRLSVLYKTDEWTTPSPEPTTSIASFICWSWIDSFVWNAHKQTVGKKDVWGLIMEDYSIFVVKKFKRFTNSLSKKRSFSTNLLIFFSPYIMLQSFWAIIASFFAFIPTLLLKRILEYVEDQTSAPKNLAWFYVTGMFVCKLLVAIANGQALFFGRRVCIRMKSVIISEVYSKALRRRVVASNKKEKEEKSSEEDPQEINDETNINGDEESSASAQLGAIINLMAVDAFKISDLCSYLHSFVEAFVMTIIALTLLYKLLGVSALVGAFVIIVFVPINFKFANILGDLQKKTLGVTDKRIQKLNEAFQAVRIIKFFSWEDNFENDINITREKELNYLLKRTLAWMASCMLWYMVPIMVTTVSFGCFIYIQGQELTTPIAFTALSLFTLLRDPLDRLSDMLSFVIQSKVSLDRVDEYLSEADTDKYNQLTVDKKKNKMAFENVSVAWTKDSQSFKLRNLNIDFKVGKLNVVIGPTGSGKTSLLMALLGEMHLLEGKIIVPSLEARQDLVLESEGTTNSIAYCSQSAWLLNDTVKNNILFSNPYIESRYNAVVEACGLKRDFEILKAGDATEIGEKGITLSGGQKQRISLARALYSYSRHLLLDDCLSAVDAHTAAWIYDNCITGPLMEGRTCILVSHNIALTLRNAELVVMLEDGRVKDSGPPIALLDKGLLGEDELVKTSIMSRHNSSLSLAHTKSALNLNSIKKSDKPSKDESHNQNNADDGKLIQEEAKAEGVVSFQVYKWYFNLIGGFKIVLLMSIVYLCAQLGFICQAWWVRSWAANNMTERNFTIANDYFPQRSSYYDHAILFNHMSPAEQTLTQNIQNSNVSKSTSHSSMYYLSIYFLIGVTSAILGTLKVFITFVAGIHASRKIFKMLLTTIMHAKLRFFDATPIGRIMNRFSKDIESIDQDLMPYIHGAFYSLIECTATIILITMITPQFLSVAVVVCVLYYFVGYFYMAGSRELKRLDSITKSPIYQHFSETLVGVTTIRAFGDESRFIQENLSKIDDNNKPFFYLWVANRWLSFRIDVIGALVVFGSGVFILTNISNLDSGLAGISLTYAISFTEGALWLVRFYSEVEMNMNSVERLQEYMAVDQEPYSKGVQEAAETWPEEGKIEINDLSLRYAPNLPKVIKNVSFTVEPKAKVGVVGRTGAGKSTIITALFRFLDAETGYIKIDGLDIASIDLERLRRSITIIPQDPTLFTGSIKSNLDPYDEYTDEQIFAALRRVNLINDNETIGGTTVPVTEGDNASVISKNVNKFLDLKNEITEGGGNLSQGQRQLVCLARSLLRNPKILLLDEATASIDYESDAKVQSTIRQEFSESTILTIAHRLRSVIDYDKILVMDAGEVKEYDHPYSLLLNKNSIFYSMCEHSGELDVLVDAAKEAFVKKLNSN